MSENKEMKKEVHILVAECCDDQSALICNNLKRVGITNPIIEFDNGREILDYMLTKKAEGGCDTGKSCLLLLDLNLPQVGGLEVLHKIKSGQIPGNISVIVIITSETQPEVEECRRLGYSNFITKPIVYEDFVTAIKKLGFILMIVEAPTVYSGYGTEMEGDDK
jgi:CheY-like chemotaxis protein